MVYCVRFADVDAYLRELGFKNQGATDAHLLYERADGLITIHKPNNHGDITEIEMQRACDAAGIDPPSLSAHWCD